VDGTETTVQIAQVHLNMPYFSGDTSAWRRAMPLYNVIMRNIPGARGPSSPDPQWRRCEESAAVQTRQQKAKEDQQKPFIVPIVIKETFSRKELVNAQTEDETLKMVWQWMRNGHIKETANGSR